MYLVHMMCRELAVLSPSGTVVVVKLTYIFYWYWYLYWH